MSIFTSSCIFVYPIGCSSNDKLQIFMVGGGANGGYGSSPYSFCGDGGCSGYTITESGYLSADGQIEITIGSSEACTIVYIDKEYIKAYPGEKMYMDYGCQYCQGGSGGGKGENSNYCYAVPGASDGNNTTATMYFKGADTLTIVSHGQGTTTRAFGESDGTLYAGGGGGGSLGPAVVITPNYPIMGTYYEYGAPGGAGGGGNGGYGNFDSNFKRVLMRAHDGEYNTGGGGGGSAGYSSYETAIYDSYTGQFGIAKNGIGGSGICIIRWGFDKDGNWLGYSK